MAKYQATHSSVGVSNVTAKGNTALSMRIRLAHPFQRCFSHWKFWILLTFLILTSLTPQALNNRVAGATYEAGVRPGDYASYITSLAGVGGYGFTENVSFYNLTVLSVSGTTININYTTTYRDHSQATETGAIDLLQAKYPYWMPFAILIAHNLAVGDAITASPPATGGQRQVLTLEMQKQYVGQYRQTVCLCKTKDSFTYWDKATGILDELYLNFDPIPLWIIIYRTNAFRTLPADPTGFYIALIVFPSVIALFVVHKLRRR